MTDERLPPRYCPTCGEELDPARRAGGDCPEHGRLIITTTHLPDEEPRR